MKKYSHEDKLKIFEKELSYIKNEEIQQSIKDILVNLPDYFYEIPASSTGKYHPKYAQGEQGLIRHTKAAVRIAIELFQLFEFNNYEKDIIVGSLILHDGCKNGRNKIENHTIPTHPLEICELIEETIDNKKFYINDICECIISHMGKWNKDFDGNEILPKPTSEIQFFVHLCDYLASRKCLEFNFDVDVIRRD